MPESPGLGTDIDESVLAMKPFNPNKNKERYSGSWNLDDNAVADV